MALIDIIVMVTCLLGITCFGMMFSKKGGESLDEFVVGGRSIPWWLAGISILATGFNSSTPLSDSRKMRNDGIAGMWFQLQSLIVGSISVIWFNRLWRRSGLTTCVAFNELRYSGKPAVFSRVFDVVVIGTFNGCIWSAIGLVAIKKLVNGIFDLPEAFMILGMAVPSDWAIVIGTVALALLYCTASGVYGVVWTDFFEALIALATSYVLFFMLYRDVGFADGLHEKIVGMGDKGAEILNVMPEFGPAFLVLLIIQPLISLGNINPGSQRMLCCKNEKETLYTHYFSVVLNQMIKPWPFFIGGLAGMFLISDAFLLENYAPLLSESGQEIPDYEMVFPALIKSYMPAGLLGLMMVSFLFAFMSSLDTNIHISASLFVNDLYRPFLFKDKGDKHYLKVTKLFMVLMTISAIVIGVLINDIFSLIILAITIHNSAGIIKCLRFFWWRINGISECVAQVVGLTSACILFFTPFGDTVIKEVTAWFGSESNDAFYATRVLLICGLSFSAAFIAMCLSGPEPLDHLGAFYRRMKPFGYWGPVAKENPDHYHNEPIGLLWVMTIAGLGMSLGVVFCCLGLLLALWTMFWINLVITVASTFLLVRGIRRLYPAG